MADGDTRDYSYKLGKDGVGQCRCGQHRRFDAAVSLSRGDLCWACEPRHNRHGEYVRRLANSYRVGARDESNAYNPGARAQTQAAYEYHWLPWAYLQRETRHAAHTRYWAIYNEVSDDGKIMFVFNIVTNRIAPQPPTSNPTARDLHHIETRDVWFNGEWYRDTHDGWVRCDESPYKNAYHNLMHQWGDSDIQTQHERTE